MDCPLDSSHACRAALAELDDLEQQIRERREHIRGQLAECIHRENEETGLAESALAVMLSCPWKGDLHSWLAATSTCRIARHASRTPTTFKIRADDDEPFVVQAVLGRRGSVWSKHDAEFDWLPWRAAIATSSIFSNVSVKRVELTVPEEADHIQNKPPENLTFSCIRIYGTGVKWTPNVASVVQGKKVEVSHLMHAQGAIDVVKTSLAGAESVTFDSVVLSEGSVGEELAKIANVKRILVVWCVGSDRRLVHTATEMFEGSRVEYSSMCPICRV